ncbi:aminodeoxychorismate synthase pabA [Aspergillus lucknowensis]|uniref:aminodeoxychorismate synthase n=1 Tax=Aspergillus lucknowensis TaxID=176173 RepID=A0ABR4LF67_9EURO
MAPLLGDWTGSGVDHESEVNQGVHQRSILFLDAYDSFSYNVVAMLEEVLGARVTVMMIDAEWPDANMVEFLRHYDAVVLGPGPGDPKVAEDVGVMADIWRLHGADMLPVLGICLGFQSLCLHYGVPVRRLLEPLHGQVHRITTSQRDIFEGVQDLEVTLYHSLYAGFDELVESTPRGAGAPAKSALDILAWLSVQPGGPSSSATRIPMAVRHREKPLWGLQFHPESCKSDRKGCNELLRNWWDMAAKYNKRHGRGEYGSLPTDIIQPISEATRLSDVAFTMMNWSASSSQHSASRSFVTRQLDAEKICEALNAPGSPTVLFQSNGRHSIISVPSPGSWRLEYYSQQQYLLMEKPPASSHLEGAPNPSNIKVELAVPQLWDILRYLMDLKKVESGDREVPFWAGFLGYFSYELGLACLAHPKHETESVQGRGSSQPSPEYPADTSLLWTDRSIVVDNETGRITIQSTRQEDNLPAGWLDSTVSLLKDRLETGCSSATDTEFLDSILRQGVIQFPDQDTYLGKVEACKDELRAGESYELCLTVETSITLPWPDTDVGRAEFPWKLYRRLRKYNPAAFSAFASLGNVKIVSSSPECFLNWDRHSILEMKPMKGTVRKSRSMTLEKAKDILGSTKEMAENLMIADLIRHDLYGICGTNGVSVEKLLEVEDHGRVYQMITHVKGRVDPRRPGYAAKGLPKFQSSNMSGYGLTALQRCLPPGSMTGAPKERSCMHLCSIEGRRRAIYSGVMGFLDLGGGGSFSVLIRTAFTSSNEMDDAQKWRIGAGGAVTMLSSAEGEWDEMLTKLRTVCGIFMPSNVK